ncbi:MAG: hypothetical protein LBJ41_08115 [Treponema sp.]|nr:hypothetical protein [Treponema sp.]
MSITTELEPDMSLLRHLPLVLRARDFRLYLEGNRRIIDLWQDNGTAILGHTPSAVLRELKSSAERGLFAPFPHFTEHRFIKVLSQLFPGKAIRVYRDNASLGRALAAVGIPLDTPIIDPSVSDVHVSDTGSSKDTHMSDTDGSDTGSSKDTHMSDTGRADDIRLFRWRPFLPFAWPCAAVLLPALPWPLSPVALVYDEPLALPPSDYIPPLILSAATRAIYDLIATAPKRQEVCHIPSTSLWQQRGVYCSLRHRLSSADYERLFLSFLDAGFLLPPDQDQPFILPTGLSHGEAAKLDAALLMQRDT